MYAGLRGHLPLGTYNTSPIPGGVRFDATRMRLADILPKEANFSHALIVYAESVIDQCKANPEFSYDLNVRSTKQLIYDLNEQGIKPIFTSSESVFDGERGNYTEDDTTRPTTVYGSHKLEIEEYLEEQGRDYVVLRLAKVFGSELNDGTILSNWLKEIQRGDEIRCARDQVFSPVHVDDVVSATDVVIRRNLSGVYHVAGPHALSRLEMLNGLLGSMGTEARVVECSIRDFTFLDNRPLNVSMNPKKIAGATGIAFKSVASSCDELASQCLG